MKPVRTLAAVALVFSAVALGGCGSESGSADDTGTDPAGTESTSESGSTSPSPTETPSETPSASPRSARTDFCAGVAQGAVRSGLQGKSVYDETWKPGESFDIVGGAHAKGAEWGCAWTAQDGTSVTAWLFAEPVDAATADGLLGKARAGCEEKKMRTPGADVAVTVQCINDDDTVTRTQALYGDAWLSCSLQTPGILTELDRAASWCDAVRAAALV